MTWDKEMVRQLRRKLALTQVEFADLLGCRQQTISEWEQGLYAPANAYGKLLDQIHSQTPMAFAVPTPAVEGDSLAGLVQDFPQYKPFDPAVD